MKYGETRVEKLLLTWRTQGTRHEGHVRHESTWDTSMWGARKQRAQCTWDSKLRRSKKGTTGRKAWGMWRMSTKDVRNENTQGTWGTIAGKARGKWGTRIYYKIFNIKRVRKIFLRKFVTSARQTYELNFWKKRMIPHLYRSVFLPPFKVEYCLYHGGIYIHVYIHENCQTSLISKKLGI